MATVTGENGDHSEGIALSSLEVAALPWVFTQHYPLSTSEFIRKAKDRGVRLDELMLRQLYKQRVSHPRAVKEQCDAQSATCGIKPSAKICSASAPGTSPTPSPSSATWSPARSAAPATRTSPTPAATTAATSGASSP